MVSSAEEHSVYTGKVIGSNPVLFTIFSLKLTINIINIAINYMSF